ncbi:amidohydrolase family protein [Kineosporia sp. R_H_3]|uniref:amidohydrolase family protein n=1 Tax=Kineosporia sp. R_H_3 TaxID=1961848 RepID=UPI0018E96ECB|nr:amidohydrolase family protein [Kineosporia sp. R_H_3]
MPPSGSVDVHQHLWTPALVEALRARRLPPYLDGWTLHVAGAAPFAADPLDHDVDARARAARDDGLALAVVALSAGLGVEHLPPDEAAAVLAGYHAGAAALPAPFAAWAAAGLVEPDPAALAALLDDGFVGLELPATALADDAGWEHCAPLLAVLERRGAPLLVHPGPAAPAPSAAPAWWSPVVDYVPQMHAGWFAFRAFGRPAFPRLRVCFTLLAGLAPLHGERLRARSGGDPAATERGRVDPDAFLDTSSYGPRALDAVVRVLGVDVLVHGSDRPWAVPQGTGLGDAADAVVHRDNPLRLLHGVRPAAHGGPVGRPPDGGPAQAVPVGAPAASAAPVPLQEGRR